MLRWEVVSTPPNPQWGGSPLVSCLRLLHFYSSLQQPTYQASLQHVTALSFEFLINALALLIRYTKMRAAAKQPSWAANRILVLECWCWHAHVMYSTSGSPPPGPDLRTLIFQARTRNAWSFSCDSLCCMDLLVSTIVSYCSSATLECAVITRLWPSLPHGICLACSSVERKYCYELTTNDGPALQPSVLQAVTLTKAIWNWHSIWCVVDRAS